MLSVEFDYRKHLATLGIPPRFCNCDFAEHEATKGRMQEIVDFVHKLDGNILMSGSCGNGKTLTAVAVIAAYTRFKGRGAYFFNSEGLYGIWREKSRDGSLSTFYESIAECPLLVLDDLGQGENSDAFNRWLYSLINKRWEWERPIVTTTNLKGVRFREVFGDAILSRLSDGKIWKFEGKDHRLPT